MLGLLLVASWAVACQVDTAAASRDATHGNYVIPVRVAPGERCVIFAAFPDGREWRAVALPHQAQVRHWPPRV